MHYYSLDTNLVIPLINPHDHNRRLVLKVVKKEKNDGVICSSVIEETRIVLRKKSLSAIEKCLKKIRKIRDFENDFDRNAFLIEALKELSESNKELRDFYKLIFNKINEYLKENSIDELPSFLSEFVEQITRIVIPILKDNKLQIIGFNYSDINMWRRLIKISKTVDKIKFKDEHDKWIFYELASFANIEFTINCYTHDYEFSKKSNKSISVLEEKINYAPSTLRFTYVN